MIELAEVIGELRRERQQACAPVGASRCGSSWACAAGGHCGGREDRRRGQVRFWVIELGGDAKASQASTQRIKLALQPRLTASGAKALIAGDEAPGER
jgi:hypothetical protein